MTINEVYGWNAGSVTFAPHDTNTLVVHGSIAAVGRGFMVNVDGPVVLGYPDGSTLTVPACKAGVQYAFRGFDKVLATGTTATSVLVGV